jgi:peptide/nickel transport system permease protein
VITPFSGRGIDLVVVRDVVMLLASMVVVVNFVVDVLYAVVDPRLRGA